MSDIIEEDTDLCGLCGGPGADKIPHPIHWPGEAMPETDLVHAECEQDECRRAHAALSDSQRDSFLREISKYG
jgi:hypothetical protein